MSFGEQMRRRREELGLTRQALADRLGVSVSAVGNYETGISAPKEEVLLRLFDGWRPSPTICTGAATAPPPAATVTRSAVCWPNTGICPCPGARPSTRWWTR